MEQLRIPAGYHSPLTIRETEVAIKEVKDHFERALAKNLHLTRVSAPLFVRPESGLNDNLNGVERPVSFDIKEQDGSVAEIVHSLAKWKRYALKNYNFHSGEGLYTDMNAIRRDEDTDNLHSIYVDQWDWEKIIGKEERTIDTLKTVVNQIYEVLKRTEMYVASFYPQIKPVLPKHITFVTTAELEDRYCGLTTKERERQIVKEHGAVYFGAIGGCGALLSKCVKKAEIVAYEDLGAEAIRRLEVENFPAVVIIDSLGNNLYESGRAAYLASLEPERT